MPYWNRVPQKLGMGKTDLILQLEGEVISSEFPGLMGKGKRWHTVSRNTTLFSKWLNLSRQSGNCQGTCSGRSHPNPAKQILRFWQECFRHRAGLCCPIACGGQGAGWCPCLFTPLHRLLPSLSFTSSSRKPSLTIGSELYFPFLLADNVLLQNL